MFNFVISCVGLIIVHMNVVPRSTIKLTQMVEQRLIDSEVGKLKCYVKPMKNPLGGSPSKGNHAGYHVR